MCSPSLLFVYPFCHWWKKKHLQKNNINCNWELQLSKTWKHTSRVSLVFNYFIPKKDYTIYSHWVEGFCLCVFSLKHANILLCVLLHCYLFVLHAIDKFVKEQLQQQPSNISTKLKKNDARTWALGGVYF